MFDRSHSRRWGVSLVLMVAAAAVAAGSARAQDTDTRPGLAVLPFDVVQMPAPAGGTPGMNFGLQQMLVTELSLNPGLRMVDRRAISEVMQELDLHGSGRVDVNTAAQIGRIVGARYMVGTSYFQAGEDIRIDARLIDVETTEILQARQVRGDDDDLFDLMGQMAGVVMEDIDLPPLPAAVRSDREEMGEIPAEAIELFSAAIEQEEMGQMEDARETLAIVMDRWPQWADAEQLMEEWEKEGD